MLPESGVCEITSPPLSSVVNCRLPSVPVAMNMVLLVEVAGRRSERGIRVRFAPPEIQRVSPPAVAFAPSRTNETFVIHGVNLGLPGSRLSAAVAAHRCCNSVQWHQPCECCNCNWESQRDSEHRRHAATHPPCRSRVSPCPGDHQCWSASLESRRRRASRVRPQLPPATGPNASSHHAVNEHLAGTSIGALLCVGSV